MRGAKVKQGAFPHEPGALDWDDFKSMRDQTGRTTRHSMRLHPGIRFLLGVFASLILGGIPVSAAVAAQVPESRAVAAPSGTEGTRPQSPSEALESFRLAPGFQIEIVAAEPLVTDPIAIDWAADGRMWVCEMHDYPAGLDGQWQPGGRVRLLTDRNGDGVQDESTVFLDALPFPTGVMAWRRGVLICAAPDILYAEDTNADGRADRVEKLFTGFATDNFQARVNSLSLGLDNWIHGANGLLGGTIQRIPAALFEHSGNAANVNIRNRDFRFRPKDGLLERVSGITQQGRVRDDWGNWFGCDNSRLLLHYPWDDRYLGRNPHVTVPDPVRHLTGRPGGNALFPASALLERFNDPEHANRVTSACGLGLYRDTLFGTEWSGNAFICEPVHNLVHREILSLENGVATSRRSTGEAGTEFLASTDHWFRPAQARAGPDGGLYVVDMYRFLIEHPRWIPAARLAQIDVRAGTDRGRIYRVRPTAAPLREVRDLTRLKPPELVAALDTTNGTERDRVHVELLFRGEVAPEARHALEVLGREAGLPQVRLQALALLWGFGALNVEGVAIALRDPDARVRRHAVGLAESLLDDRKARDAEGLLAALLALVTDPSPLVRRQLAFTLGEIDNARAGKALAALAEQGIDDPELRLAVLTSAATHAESVLRAVMAIDPARPGRAEWIPPLVATMADDERDAGARSRALALILPPVGIEASAVQWTAFTGLIEGAGQEQIDAWNIAPDDDDLGPRWRAMAAHARQRAADESLPPEDRRLAILAVGGTARESSDAALLIRLAMADAEPLVRQAARDGLRRSNDRTVADRLLERWAQSLPSARDGIIGLLLDRPGWSAALLEAVRRGQVLSTEISASQRQRLAASPDAELREAADSIFPRTSTGGRDAVVARYRSALAAAGDPKRGREVFTRACSTCHALAGVGHEVGPDLAPLGVKDSEYWLLNTLDPNAVVEPRFVHYEAELADGSHLSGLIKAETATSLTVVSGGGLATTVLRSQVRDLHASSLSFMPEGLEEGITLEEMADLIAFVRSGGASGKLPGDEPAATGRATDSVLRDAPSVARFVLDGAQSDAARSTAVQANPQFAAALIREMTRDLVPGAPEEYRRIPWIWRVAIAAGRRNDEAQVRGVLEASLPGPDEPLLDWQAVVLGGGLINGISERQPWPGVRIVALLVGRPDLEAGWERALELASRMADDERVPHGTRYDALRMLGVDTWNRRGSQLARYLEPGTPGELQMGAVSGLGDMSGTEAGLALLGSLPHLTPSNRKLALDALLRDNGRRAALRAAFLGGRVNPDLLDAERREFLLQLTPPNGTVR